LGVAVWPEPSEAYVLNATPTVFENLQELANRLSIKLQNNLPAGYLKKYKAINKKAIKLKGMREKLQ